MFLFNTMLVVFLCLCVPAFSKDLPKTFHKCVRSHPNFDDCLLNAVNDALKQMKNGLPKFGILPLDPLEINSLSIGSSPGSPITLEQKYQNIKIYRLTESKITKYRTDLNKYIIKTEAFTPILEFVGDYSMDGRILLLPVVGNGRSNITITGLVTKHELIGAPVTKGNETFMEIKDYNIKFEPKGMKFELENLFNGDKLLGDTMNNFLNENWETVFSELRGGYEDTFGYIFKQITNNIFSKVPMNKIFLLN